MSDKQRVERAAPALSSYDQEFFAEQSGNSTRAAEIILSWVVQRFAPSSIVDVGCGAGGWLKVALDAGVSDVLGVDGGAGAEQALLAPAEFVIWCDLEAGAPAVDRQFDLAICLEVLEHLSSEAAARVIAWLCEHASVILFSAALPGQRARTHINLRWLSEWANAFSDRGFLTYDIVRHRFWSDDRIPYWYRQNVVM